MHTRTLLLASVFAIGCSSSVAASIEGVIRPFLVPAGAETLPAVDAAKKIPGATWRQQEAGRIGVWSTASVKGRKGLVVSIHGDRAAASRLRIEQFIRNGVNDSDVLNDKSLGRGDLKQMAMECSGTGGTVPAYQFTAPGFKPVYVVFDESFGTREGSTWVDVFHMNSDMKLRCETGG